jgi:aminomuconate-semialdehyde/2-hydroxymuconate-6-semialdehyde dehydrogenase
MEMAERTELLYAVANEINRRFDNFLQAEIADTGKPASLARHIATSTSRAARPTSKSA